MSKGYYIHPYTGERWLIDSVDQLAGMINLQSELESHHKEPAIYTMSRIVSGTRKREYTIQCYRSTKTGEFIPLLS